MKYYFYKGKKIDEEGFAKLPEEEQKKAREWREKGGEGRKKTESKKKERVNDPSWYYVSENLLNSVANVPFNRFPGLTDTVIGQLQVVPGVLEIEGLYTYGPAKLETDGINVAAKALYTYVRHQNSGKTNYESADLMLYVLAMDQIYTAWCEVVRIYRVMTTFEMVNRQVPRTILSALGVGDADAMIARGNLANIRARLNLIAAKIGAMAMPKAFNIYKRHALMASTVFMDSSSQRGQYYVFNARGWLKYNPILSENGGGLEFKDKEHAGDIDTVNYLLTLLESMVEAVFADEDMNIMSGDLLKVFGAEGCHTIDEIGDMDPLVPVYDEDVLQQIENSFCPFTKLGQSAASALPKYEIQQSGNVLITKDDQVGTVGGATGSTFSNVGAGEIYFNSHKDTVTTADIMEWSRMTNTVPPTAASMKGRFSVIYCTELILSYRVHTIVASTTNASILKGYRFGSFRFAKPTGSTENGEQCVNSLTAELVLSHTLSKFDWHPGLYGEYESTTTGGYLPPALDLKKYTIIYPENMAAMNDVAIVGAINALPFVQAGKKN